MIYASVTCIQFNKAIDWGNHLCYSLQPRRDGLINNAFVVSSTSHSRRTTATCDPQVIDEQQQPHLSSHHRLCCHFHSAELLYLSHTDSATTTIIRVANGFPPGDSTTRQKLNTPAHPTAQIIIHDYPRACVALSSHSVNFRHFKHHASALGSRHCTLPGITFLAAACQPPNLSPPVESPTRTKCLTDIDCHQSRFNKANIF